ncbi:hypothetical protein SAY87_028824 [Trapa incisa]|uniref:F-box domain-containing protein n=1 Tax=Trapa incisa TaxID=236973 RepID=A0AAN7KVK7_9MYRT|nr:hypothetical protein SAY87_028824 [Trapa incisa]
MEVESVIPKQIITDQLEKELISSLCRFIIHYRPSSRHCFADFDDTTSEYHSSVMAAKKSRTNLKNLDLFKLPPSKKSRKERKKKSDVAASGEVLDEEIWKEFPEVLFEAVIARLPIDAFFRARIVCRKWNSLLESPSFAQQCSEVQREWPWFYTATYANSGALYDPSSKRWYNRPCTSTFPQQMILLSIASAGGILCFIETVDMNFFVCNPFTGSNRCLPARTGSFQSQIAVGMTMNSRSGVYKIVWLGSNGEYGVYDSERNSWIQTGSMPPDIRLPLFLNSRSQAVSIGNNMYFMRSNPDGIVSYNKSSGLWTQLMIPLPPHLSDHTLAECDRRIILAGLLTKNAATCVCIWELQRMTLLWKEVDRMPNSLCLEFYGKVVRMACLGNRGLLMLSLKSGQMNRLVTYDVARREWEKQPGCALPRDGRRKRQLLALGTAFYPSLTAKA